MKTILSLVQEMQSFIKVAPSTLEKAENSKIDNIKNKEFFDLVMHWQNGTYDEDPDTLLAEMEILLQTEINQNPLSWTQKDSIL